MVVAHHVAVVRDEANQRVVVHAPRAQRPEDQADLLVDEGDGGIVVLLRILHVRGAEIAVCGVGILLRIGCASESGAPVAHSGTGNIDAVVGVDQPLRSVVGAVRPGERNGQEEGFAGAEALDGRHGLPAGPAGGMQLFGQRIGRRAVRVPADTRGVGVESGA